MLDLGIYRIDEHPVGWTFWFHCGCRITHTLAIVNPRRYAISSLHLCRGHWTVI